MARYRNARYPRTARLNELLREIIAEELERIGDERIELVAVTQVVVDADLNVATTYFDSLTGAEGDDEVLAALAEHRVRVQAAIGRQARMKKTPRVVFRPDDVERDASRVEGILRDLNEE